MPTTLEIEDRGPARWIWLAREARRNALDPVMIGELRAAIDEAASAGPVRSVVLAGRGSAFSAGADINWMREAAGYSDGQNLADAEALAGLLHAIHTCPRPVLARIHGAAVGGGVGLAAAADIVIASTEAWFQLSETRLGLVAATISPYLVAAMGPRQASRWLLTAERFDAGRAQEIGLVAETVPAFELDTRLESMLATLAEAGPAALAATKDLLDAVAHRPIDAELRTDTAGRIADARRSEEGREGIAAFLEKREPSWRRP